MPVEHAFRFSVSRVAAGLVLSWTAAPGHYLYRDRFEATLSGGRDVTLDAPPGEAKDDPNFGATQVFYGRVSIPLAASALPAKGALRVTYQGCAESGFCYAPVTKTVDLRSLSVGDE